MTNLRMINWKEEAFLGDIGVKNLIFSLRIFGMFDIVCRELFSPAHFRDIVELCELFHLFVEALHFFSMAYCGLF